MVGADSSLVSYILWSPNHSGPRKHAIDTITIHCVVGQCSVETLGQVFAPVKRQASCQYGIGYDGRVGQYCKEANRSWCTSSASNDNRAITIEVASDKSHPYAITDAAYKSLIVLCADICKRNNIKELKWINDKSLIGQVDKQNMTVHRWFANKACPGDYIFSRLGKIADEVNKLIKGIDIVNNKIEVGDTVKFTKDAVQWNGKPIPPSYKDKVYEVKQIDNNGRTVLKIGETVMYAVDAKYLKEIINDIVESDWVNTASDYAKESWAKAKSIGVFDGTNPQSPLTREQAAVVLDRLNLLK